MDKTDKFIEKALKKMFKVVGAPYSQEFCEEDAWYLKYSWTSDERDKFKEWFIKEFIKTFKLGKLYAEKEWGMFYLNWGWKEENEIHR